MKKKGLDWNEGLTKETDERVRKQSESLKKSYKEGKIIPWNKNKKNPTRTKLNLLDNPAKSPEVKKKIGEAQKGRVHSLSERKKRSCSMKKNWNDKTHIYNSEKFRKNRAQSLKGVPKSEEHKNKLSISSKKPLDKRIKDPKILNKELERRSLQIRGENNPRWTGGRPPHYYGINWREQQRKARIKLGDRCEDCSKVTKYSLHVHHIKPFKIFIYEYLSNQKNKKLLYSDLINNICIKANKLSNLICLCIGCHIKHESLAIKKYGKKFSNKYFRGHLMSYGVIFNKGSASKYKTKNIISTVSPMQPKQVVFPLSNN